MPSAGAAARDRRDEPERDVRIAATLPRLPLAAATARGLVRRELGDVLAGETLDDVLLVVSELATNAVLHGAGEIQLRLAYDGERIAGAVSDQGPAFAVAAEPRAAECGPGGRGLFIVGRVSKRWGMRDESASVWFEIPAR